jgi:hypothetical protein
MSSQPASVKLRASTILQFKIMIKNILLLLGTLASLNAWADLPIADFENKNKTQATNSYLLGLSAGLNTANAWLISNKQAPLYCYPPYLNLTSPNYREIITLGIQEFASDSSVKPSVDEILLKKLRALYPCGYN